MLYGNCSSKPPTHISLKQATDGACKTCDLSENRSSGCCQDVAHPELLAGAREALLLQFPWGRWAVKWDTLCFGFTFFCLKTYLRITFFLLFLSVKEMRLWQRLPSQKNPQSLMDLLIYMQWFPLKSTIIYVMLPPKCPVLPATLQIPSR